jgi:ankyrin repeat protein
MCRTLSPDSTLETQKKEAKRWLKALRAGDAQARRRLIAATPAVPVDPGLRDVQLALAREYGLPGWSALRQALDDLALARRSHAERVDRVLRSATWGGDRITAARILARWPEISTDSLYAAVATGNLAEIERRLAAGPAAAGRKGGPLDREPLLYLAYARLPGGETNGLDLARALLDHGADPNVRWMDDWGNPFTALTGVIGQGEGNQPLHPQAEALARLLIERGADPYDTQALYNTSITRDDTTWLDILWTESERRGRLEPWRAVPETPIIGGAVPLKALDYLLGNAVACNHITRAEWLLTHGANANGPHAYSKRPLREEALIHGYEKMADLLKRFGAEATPLQGQAAFQAACMRLDREAAQAVAAQRPQCLSAAEPMLTAARDGRADVVALLLELGVDIDVADETEQRGLHNAVAGGFIEVVRLLVAHGADVDRPTTRYGGALDWAAHFQQREIAAFLAPVSRDVHSLTYLAMTERLDELFAADPSQVNAVHSRFGFTPLFTLPEDEEEAVEMASFLLAHGADPKIRNTDGFTPEHVLRQRGLIDAADLMEGNHGEGHPL